MCGRPELAYIALSFILEEQSQQPEVSLSQTVSGRDQMTGRPELAVRALSFIGTVSVRDQMVGRPESTDSTVRALSFIHC